MAGCGDKTVRIFDTATGKQRLLLRTHADWVQSVAFSRNGTQIVTASRDRTARVVNALTGELEATYSGHDGPVMEAAFSSNGLGVYSIDPSKAVHFWDPATGKKKIEYLLPSNAQIFASGMDRLFTATADHLVRIIQLSDRETLFTLYGQRDVIASMALSRTGDYFATGAEDGEICVWSLACGTWIERFIASPR